MRDFDKAKDKVMLGPEKQSMLMTREDKIVTAYHEAGHAIVGLTVPGHDPIHKVTIVPRGRALGVTVFLPRADKYSYSKKYLEAQLAGLFGGRVAEELVFGKKQVTTGASNDISTATSIARRMVMEWGLSGKVGPISYAADEQEEFLGRSPAGSKHGGTSEEISTMIDNEVRILLGRAYLRAESILRANMSKLHSMSNALVEDEVLSELQIKSIMYER